MSDISVLKSLIDAGAIGRTLKLDSNSKAQIKVLQEVLHALGFGKALSWDRFGPDGSYGKSTVRAVAAFAKANGITSDGSSVNAKLGRLLVQRFEFLDEMHHMQDAINSSTILKDLRYKSSNQIAVTVLQDILHEHGLDAELNWEKFGADGEYGKSTRAAVKAFSEKHGIESDGNSVTLAMAKASLKDFVGFYGKDWYQESPKVLRESLQITSTSKHTTVSDGVSTKKFRRFRRGHYTMGNVKTADFINANRVMLKKEGMSDSALNVMLGVSENEGNIDAINTWDNAFMTFGLFQWTIGVGNAAGELPALFKKIKEAAPEAFKKFYGQYGLDVSSKTGEIRGNLTLYGQLMNTKAEKEQFRDPKWCFYFWKAGQDSAVQTVSVQHAFSRIGTFARSSSYQVNGHDVADIVTSEYGMALVLDNHVNRPAYIKGCLRDGMNAAGLGGSDPKSWGTEQERAVIKQYLRVRESYGKSPMTDAKKRAQVTKRYLTKGIISDARGSFKY
ncbi:MAG: peptidoglycan-binding domain-containing protein [Pseudomonadota bacterium]